MTTEANKGLGPILIVEDSLTQAEQLRHVLEQHRYQCLLARHGGEALALLDSARPALIVSDVLMPVMDGFELCQRVKADPRFRDVPFILLTSLADLSDIIRGLECGADNFVTKPYDQDYLLARIDSMYARQHPHLQRETDAGVEVDLEGRRHLITAGRGQILDLLLSTYEQAVQINDRLKLRERELEALNARLAALHAIGISISQSLDLDRILNDSLDRIAEVIAIEAAAAFLCDAEDLRLEAARGWPADFPEHLPRRAPEFAPFAQLLSAERSSPSMLELTPELARHFPGLHLVGLRLRASSSTLGCVVIASTSSPELPPADLDLLQGVGSQLAIAIENARLFASERKARAQAEAASRSKDEFLATVSHELRTPLNAMLGYTHLLRSGKLTPDETARAIETIERNARSQNQLIADLLDMSRIISGKLRLHLQPVNLAAIVESAIETVQPAATAKGIRIEKHLDSSAGSLMGDATRLQQVVWNLLSNAIKFTPREGGVKVSLKRDEGQAEISVSDSGAGISSDFLPFVFDRFRQADSSSTRTHGGLGLGLAIVRNLVELHGGTVRAESQGAGHGATFIVRLPRQTTTAEAFVAEAPEAPSRLTPEHAQLLSGVRVLVVDDESDTRALLTALLAQASAEVRVAESAGAALEALDAWNPDIIVSDIAMPDGDGYDLIRHIRARSVERGGRIPAIALTAYARLEDRLRVLAAGFQIHIAKPVEPAELITVIASLTGRLAGKNQVS